jgi:hypothetical protein
LYGLLGALNGKGEGAAEEVQMVSWQHEQLANTYLGYASDWVGLTEHVAPKDEDSLQFPS